MEPPQFEEPGGADSARYRSRAAGNGNLLDTITIDGTNPFNPFGVDLDPEPMAESAAIIRSGAAWSKAGPRRFEQTVKTDYGTATLDGMPRRHDWYWDINGI